MTNYYSPVLFLIQVIINIIWSIPVLNYPHLPASYEQDDFHRSNRLNTNEHQTAVTIYTGIELTALVRVHLPRVDYTRRNLLNENRFTTGLGLSAYLLLFRTTFYC